VSKSPRWHHQNLLASSHTVRR